jgi:hypothetical protein
LGFLGKNFCWQQELELQVPISVWKCNALSWVAGKMFVVLRKAKQKAKKSPPNSSSRQ